MRLHILSKKISTRALAEEGLESSKILFYKFMVRYHVHEKDLLSASKAY